MQRRTIPFLASIGFALALQGCNGEKNPEDTGEDPGTVLPGLCAGDSWGLIDKPEMAVHVATDGADTAAGTYDDPVSSVTAALELTRALTEDRYIAIAPGTYVETIILGSNDNDTVIQGCSTDEVTIEASDSQIPVVSVGVATGVTVQGISVDGGRRSVQVWSNATGILLSDIVVQNASETGVLIHGNGTEATLTNIEVYDTEPTNGGFGYGVALQEGATVTMSGGGVWNSTAVGVLIEDVTAVDISNIEVDGTKANADGYYGRGVQFQSDCGLSTLVDTTISGSDDAGIFVMEPIVYTMTGNTILTTTASAIPDSYATSGDGVVITRGDNNRNPADFDTTLEDNTVTGSDRAGILLDGVTSAVSGNTISDVSFEIVRQNSASVSGNDDVAELSGDDVLDLNLMPLTPVDPGASEAPE